LANLTDVKTLALNTRDFFQVLQGIRQAKKILKRVKPEVVFSKGSYVAVPVGIAAHRLGVPIITHDSDAMPGLANRFLGRWAELHAVGQPLENYKYPSEKTRFTGIPLDERIKAVSPAQQIKFKKQLGLPQDSVVLLVAGGGLGSGRLNDLMAKMAPELLSQQKSLRIIVIAGQQHQDAAAKAYNLIPQASDRVQVIGFTADFYQYSGAADLILCRAGATTLAEFAVQHKACVIIPAEQLAGGHQLANVWQISTAEAAVVLEPDVRADKLLKTVSELLQDKRRREELGAKFGSMAEPQAADKLADLILQTIMDKTDKAG